MTNQVYQYAGGYGTVAIPNAPILSPRDPIDNQDTVSPNGNPYQLLQGWRNTTSGALYQFAGGGQWVLVTATGGDPIQSIITDSGTALPAAGAVSLVGGSGVNTSASGSTVTINVTGFGIKYTTVTANTSMQIDSGYITNKAGTAASMLLPATAPVGSAISVVGRGATGWIITQAAGQSINMNSVSTTVGVGGSLASSAQFNSVNLICTIANTTWTVINSEGVLTVT